MKRQWLALSQQYQAALEKHLQQGPKSPMQAAHRLGRHAVALGLETAGLTGIHRTALTALLLPSCHIKKGTVKQAATFLVQAIASLRAARPRAKSGALAGRESALLQRRATRLVAANRRLKQGVVDRKTAGDALKKSSRHYAKLLRESELLKKHLRHLTHRLLSAQEAERRKIVFIHLSHSNPAALAGTPERAAIEAAGMRVAVEGERIDL